MSSAPELPPVKFLKSFHISPRLGAVYVNNAKVACSTIKLALQRAELEDPCWRPSVSVHDHRTSPLLTWPDLTMETWQEALEGRFTFSFVRNPFGRLRSAYRNKILHKQGRHVERAGFHPDYRPSFDEFLESVFTIDPIDHDSHWRPQVLNLGVGHVRLDFVGRLEAFSRDWAHVSGKLGLPERPERAGKSTKGEPLVFSEAQRKEVARVYRQDFDLFDYDPTNSD